MQFLNRLRLGTKFSIILVLVFIVGISVGGFVLYRALEQRAEDEVATRGLLLLETMNGARAYTSQQINPLLQEQQAVSDEFISQTVPAFSAREIFDNFRASEHEDFFYKEATLNPTNPLDQADGFETEIVEQFRADSDLSEQTGFRTRDGQNTFYIARPITITNENCLVCHSDPALAPETLVAKYGETAGFGWELNETVGAQIIYVPAEEVFDNANLSFLTVIGIFLAIFGVVLVTLNIVMRPTILSPVASLADFAQRIGERDISEEEIDQLKMSRVSSREDELGQLARTFEEMAQNVYKREANLKRQVQELKVEIDSGQKMKQVSEITESEYFQNLKKRAENLRNRHDDS